MLKFHLLKKKNIGLFCVAAIVILFLIYNAIWMLYLQKTYASLIDKMGNDNFSAWDYTLSCLKQENMEYVDEISNYKDEDNGIVYYITFPEYLHFKGQLHVSMINYNINPAVQYTGQQYEIQIEFSQIKNRIFSCNVLKEQGDELSTYIQYDIYLNETMSPSGELNQKEQEVFDSQKNIIDVLKQYSEQMWGYS